MFSIGTSCIIVFNHRVVSSNYKMKIILKTLIQKFLFICIFTLPLKTLCIYIISCITHNAQRTILSNDLLTIFIMKN